jgi:hypothetical protein
VHRLEYWGNAYVTVILCVEVRGDSTGAFRNAGEKTIGYLFG